jgi:hypothetical protein
LFLVGGLLYKTTKVEHFLWAGGRAFYRYDEGFAATLTLAFYLMPCTSVLLQDSPWTSGAVFFVLFVFLLVQTYQLQPCQGVGTTINNVFVVAFSGGIFAAIFVLLSAALGELGMCKASSVKFLVLVFVVVFVTQTIVGWRLNSKRANLFTIPDDTYLRLLHSPSVFRRQVATLALVCTKYSVVVGQLPEICNRMHSLLVSLEERVGSESTERRVLSTRKKKDDSAIKTRSIAERRGSARLSLGVSTTPAANATATVPSVVVTGGASSAVDTALTKQAATAYLSSCTVEQKLEAMYIASALLNLDQSRDVRHSHIIEDEAIKRTKAKFFFADSVDADQEEVGTMPVPFGLWNSSSSSGYRDNSNLLQKIIFGVDFNDRSRKPSSPGKRGSTGDIRQQATLGMSQGDIRRSLKLGSPEPTGQRKKGLSVRLGFGGEVRVCCAAAASSRDGKSLVCKMQPSSILLSISLS